MIDNLLIPLIIEDTDLHQTFTGQIAQKYTHVVRDLPPNWVPAVIDQFLAFKLFGPDGLALNYFAHPLILRKSPREQEYLYFQFSHPWRFAFIRPQAVLGNNVFEMKNALTEESLLLYSPGIAKYEALGGMSLYFALLASNGDCFQTYGPISYFQGLQPYDLLFFAQQLEARPLNLAELEQRLQQDPLPFMALFIAAKFPLTYHKTDLLVINQSELGLEKFDPPRWERYFFLERKEDLYKLGLKHWRKGPHFCSCYFSSQEQRLIVGSLTERGYNKLVGTLAELGFVLPAVPEIRVTAGGLLAAEKVLRKKIILNPYEQKFSPKPAPDSFAQPDDLKRFTELLIPYLNSEAEFDLERLAQQADIPYETALKLAHEIRKTLHKIN